MSDTNTGLRDTVAATDGNAPRAGRTAFEFTRGNLINRYVVLERLGAGGMSIVYAAYDPELRRRVALKLLLVDTADADQARLLREARAIARLSHPNVVTVFDVGTFEGRVYVAMEYIDGQTLRQWRAAAPRTWEDILAIFLDAARGLSAAHAAGLVHRDFKPENVLIGKDGRVRVLDFGLARKAVGELETSVAKSFESVVVPGTDVFRVEISRAGALVGTPAYMAPEQLADATIDHRTDQFGFCVSLFECLYGARPFKGETTLELLTSITHGTIDYGTTRGSVPPALTRVLLRGLSPHANHRYATMDELMRALERARTARLRLRLSIGAGALALAGGLAAFTVLQPEPRAARCDDAEQRITDVWNPDRAAAVEASLVATGLEYAKDTGPRASEQLTRHADGWREAHAWVCDATYVHRSQSRPLLDARLACLDENLADLRTAVGILADADAGVAEYAVQAASELPAPDRCTSAPERASASSLTPAAAAAIAGVRETLSRVRVENNAGRHASARELARTAVDAAKATNHAPVQAEALLQLALTEIANEDVKAGATLLGEAYDLAEETMNDEVRATAAIHLIRVTGELLNKDAEAINWGRVANAVIRRLGSPPQLVLKYHANLASVHLQYARYLEALTDLNRAIDLDKNAASYRLAAYHERRGDIHLQRGHHDDARTEYEAAVRLAMTSLGPRHPRVAEILARVGWNHREQRHTALAEEAYRRALAITEAAFGNDSPKLEPPLTGLAAIAFDLGDYATAVTITERAHQLVERKHGPRDLVTAIPMSNHAEALLMHGSPAEALRLGEQALAVQEEAYGPDHEDLADVLANLARAHLALKQHDDAEQYYARAVANLERTHGPNFRLLTKPLTGQGLLALDRERPAEAIAPLERALVLARGGQESHAEHAELRLALAEALWRTGKDRPRARSLALEVQAHLREASDSPARTRWLADAESWLAAHPERA